MKPKPKPKSPFTGRWDIVSMETWDEDYFNVEVQAFVEFEKNGIGRFQFGYVLGCIDWRPATRDGKPGVEWSWDGTDEVVPVQGRGWAILQDGDLHGKILFHRGDESGLVAKRSTEKRRSIRL